MKDPNFSLLIRGLIGAVLLASPLPAFAQDSRENPFLQTSTPEEEKIIQDRERMRQVVREMMPEVRSMLTPAFDEQRTSIESAVKQNVLESVRNDPVLKETIETAKQAAAQAAAAAAHPSAAPSAANSPAAPGTSNQSQQSSRRDLQGSKYVACINGKALYRDKDGLNFFVEPTSDNEKPCQR